MGPADCDIYRSDDGYVAVANPTRRLILQCLAEKDRELSDLVRATRKSKPTLSNLHVRELLAQGLVEELPHPTDARRKLYRLRGRRVASPSPPATGPSPAASSAHALALGAVVDVLVAAEAPDAALRRQAAALGRATAHEFLRDDPRDLLVAAASLWEREAVATVQKVDFERLGLEVQVDERFCRSRACHEAVGVVLAGFLDGVLQAAAGGDGRTTARVGVDRRVVLRVPGPARGSAGATSKLPTAPGAALARR